jgi:hypothetical protein
LSFRSRLALAACLLVVGCGYRLASAPGSDTVAAAVPLFENRTFEPFLHARVTERVKARLISSGPWRLVNRPERAGLVVRGAVTGFGVTTLSFDAANRPLEQRVSITAEITAESDGKTPVQVTLTGTAEYTETADSLQTRAAKDRALEEASDGVAESLVVRLYAQREERTVAPSPAPDRAPTAP